MLAMLWLKLKRMRSDIPLYAIMSVMAIIMSLIFGSAMSKSALRVNIVDNDDTHVSHRFTESFNSDSFVFKRTTLSEAQKAVEKSESVGAVVIPKGFGNLTKENNANLKIIGTSYNADLLALENAARTAYGLVEREYRLYEAIKAALLSSGANAPSPETLGSKLLNLDNDANFTVNYQVAQSSYDETFATNIHFIMGYNVFFVMFSIIFSMASLLEDRSLHTWKRIRISPISSAAVLAGHLIPAYVVGISQMGIVLFAGQELFGYGIGQNFMLILAVFAAYVLCAVCLGLLLATALNTINQMVALTPVLVVASGMLGGCMWPLSLIDSKVMLFIANIMPQKWAVEATEKLAVHGASFEDISPNIFILVIMAAVLFGISALLYGKKQNT